jgi:hypothetical protein
LDRTLSLKPKKRWRLFRIISRPPNLDRNATLTYEGDRYSSRLETSCIFEYLLLEVFNGSA